MNECYDFCPEKNGWLQEHRSISFEEIISIIDDQGPLSIVSHPNEQKYPNQQMYLIDIEDYIYVVPFVRKDRKTVFLKTIFKSRKMTKQYLAQEKFYE